MDRPERQVEYIVVGWTLDGNEKFIDVVWDGKSRKTVLSLSLNTYFINYVKLDNWKRNFLTGQEEQNEAFEEIRTAFPDEEPSQEEGKTAVVGPRRLELVMQEACKPNIGPKKVLVVTHHIPPNRSFRCDGFQGRIRMDNGVLVNSEVIIHCNEWRIVDVCVKKPAGGSISRFFGNTILGGEDAIKYAVSQLKLFTPRDLTAVRNWKPASEDDEDEGVGYGAYGRRYQAQQGWPSHCPNHYQKPVPQVAHYRVMGDDQGVREFKEYLEKMKKEGLKAAPLAEYVARTMEKEVSKKKVRGEPTSSKIVQDPSELPESSDEYELLLGLPIGMFH